MNVAFLFPGQGSQVPGMLHTLPDHPTITRTLDEISETLKQNVLQLDSPEALRSTVSVQLALLASGVAVARTLTARGVEAAAVAGMSAGTFAAAVTAGVLELADGIRLLKRRAERMLELFPKGYGLAAIVGLTEKQVSTLVEDAFTARDPVYVANINAPRQIVIAGSNEGMNKVLEAARKSGSRKAVRLDVSEPSHCPLLQPVADTLRKSLQALHLHEPKLIYVGNVTGRALRTAEAISGDLATNIAHGVRWHDATSVLIELGCHLFLEMPPGHTLSQLAQQNLSGARSIPVEARVLPRVLRLAQQEEADPLLLRSATFPRSTIPAITIMAVAVFSFLGMTGEPSNLLPFPLSLRAKDHTLSLTLRAAIAPDGKNSFYYNGQPNAPTLRLSPGDQLKITYINDLPANPRESCAIASCMDMTNLHFHGLTVSPDPPQDDVLNMMAMPGHALRYIVQIPQDHPPGLYWYHTHPHGESHRQVLDGMSGALVIEGMESYFPPLAGLPERVLVVRGRSIVNDPQAANLKHRVELGSDVCRSVPGKPDEIMTVSGAVRPEIDIAPRQRQFWRLVNASADRYVDLQLEGQTFEIVAMDGMPIAEHDPNRRTRSADHVLLPPAGRLEAIVSGPEAGTPTRLVSRCVDTGPDGDPNPAMILADIVPGPSADSTLKAAKNPLKPVVKTVDLTAEENTAPRFIVTFTEKKSDFYINGEKFAPDGAPMLHAKVGTFQHWRIVNATKELHPMHIHQVHFLAYAENDKPIVDPLWLDTVNVPYGGSVDVIMDFTDPIIRGMSVFHCHLLNHEDKGMMAKILFE